MLETLGSVGPAARTVYLAEAERIEDLAGDISLPCQRYVLLLAYDDSNTSSRLTTAMAELLDRGCVYLLAWGPGCEHVHDTMDDAIIDQELRGHPPRTIMTTWHDSETLEEVVECTLRWALPDDALLGGWEAIVLAAVNNPEWSAELRAAARNYLTGQ